jgi:alginate O-acetyltransferase complex protein AlgI
LVFSSPVFLFLFLPVVLALHFLAPKRLRNAVLLAASLVFFFWGEQVYFLLMIASIAANYAFGLAVDSAGHPRRRKRWVTLAIVFNLASIAIFKYADFLAASASAALQWLGLIHAPLGKPGALFGGSQFARDYLLDSKGAIRLPIGISFFTFHAMSYVIDVYRRETRAQKNALAFALYIADFPQLIAGPIVRYKDIAAQLRERAIGSEKFVAGVRRFVIGLAKKVLIADIVARPADFVFALPKSELSTSLAWFGVSCYTLQLYFDFSGYSDMALGLGKMFGFEFRENFDYPYVSRSITEFWRRWHISLSTWFRDYVYVPLGGNRRGRARTYFNLLLIFFLCGLWHGAAWSFVVWGLYHGAFLVIERATMRERVPRLAAGGAWRHAYTLLVVMVGWVFFRASSFASARDLVCAMFGGAPLASALHPIASICNAQILLSIAAGVVGSTPWMPRLAAQRRALLERSDRTALASALEVAAALGVIALFALATLRVSAANYSPFVYFRF